MGSVFVRESITLSIAYYYIITGLIMHLIFLVKIKSILYNNLYMMIMQLLKYFSILIEEGLFENPWVRSK